jgi:magnesium-transporting ATPase (P-type)
VPNVNLPKSHIQMTNYYAKNAVKSTRYNIFNFLPVALLLQYTKVVNCIFLLNVILNAIPSVSQSNPLNSLSPMLVVVLFGMGIEAVADVKRHLSDRKTNSQPATKIVCGTNSKLEDFMTVRTDKIKVGDIIVVKDDEVVPADCILLSTDPNKTKMNG